MGESIRESLQLEMVKRNGMTCIRPDFECLGIKNVFTDAN